MRPSTSRAAPRQDAELLAQFTDSKPKAQDRAAAVTTTVIAISRRLPCDGASLALVRAEIEAVLRDEFSDIKRQTLNDIRLND